MEGEENVLKLLLLCVLLCSNLSFRDLPFCRIEIRDFSLYCILAKFACPFHRHVEDGTSEAKDDVTRNGLQKLYRQHLQRPKSAQIPPQHTRMNQKEMGKRRRTDPAPLMAMRLPKESVCQPPGK